MWVTDAVRFVPLQGRGVAFSQGDPIGRCLDIQRTRQSDIDLYRSVMNVRLSVATRFQCAMPDADVLESAGSSTYEQAVHDTGVSRWFVLVCGLPSNNVQAIALPPASWSTRCIIYQTTAPTVWATNEPQSEQRLDLDARPVRARDMSPWWPSE